MLEGGEIQQVEIQHSQITDVKSCCVLQWVICWILWLLVFLVSSVVLLMSALARRIEVGTRLVKPVHCVSYHDRDHLGLFGYRPGDALVTENSDCWHTLIFVRVIAGLDV